MRTIIITGAGSGIGHGVAACLAGRGYAVVATDKDESAAAATAASIRHAGGAAAAFALDVTDEAAIAGFMTGLGDRPCDILFNNAGLQHVAPLEEFPQATWDQLIRVTVNGTCMMTRAVLPRMRATGFGRIVNTGSIHSLVASKYKTAYVTAKHAIVGFSKVVALETADTDITINTICPSYVRTPLVDKQIAAQAASHGISEEDVIREIMLEPMPKGAFVTFEEIAGTIEFLAGAAARNITGQTIVMDGGWSCR